jgi:hypothetical protein
MVLRKNVGHSEKRKGWLHKEEERRHGGEGRATYVIWSIYGSLLWNIESLGRRGKI